MKTISTEALKSWLDQIAQQKTLYAPRNVDDVLLYKPVNSNAEIVFEFTRPKMSAREAVFPQSEHFLTIEKHGKDVSLSDNKMGQPQVVFGVRPCDAHGMAVLDAVFITREPVDTVYERRRADTTLIGLACPKMWEGCFCTAMGGGPNDASHLDILLTAVEGGYAVQAVTEKGQALLDGIQLQEQAGEPPAPLTSEAISPLPAHWPEHFSERYWDLLAERCIGCRICSYVCPTCRCFDVRDEVQDKRTNFAKYDRIRCWDACTGPNYRLAAGGHNSRPTKGTRLRNRFFCKFFYIPQDYGSTGCVGCGRCIEACPVNIDIVEMLNDVQAMEVTA